MSLTDSESSSGHVTGIVDHTIIAGKDLTLKSVLHHNSVRVIAQVIKKTVHRVDTALERTLL